MSSHFFVGHMIYEMGSGTCLTEVKPSKGFSYDKVADIQVRDFVKYIFKMSSKKSSKKAIKKVISGEVILDYVRHRRLR